MNFAEQTLRLYAGSWGQLTTCLSGAPSGVVTNGTVVMKSVNPLECVTSEGVLFTFTLMIIMGLFTFLASAITNNDSWVDRLWSIAPVAFGWTFFSFNSSSNSGFRLDSPGFVYTVLVTMWGFRLTFNFYRRGGYKKGGEDYRWMHVRTWPMFRSRVVWFVFSFLVVSIFQSWLLWAITLPLQSLPVHRAVSVPEKIFAAGFLFFLALETLTDQQQWEFQCEKRFQRPRRLGVDYDIGFCIDGVFAFSRHMNVWSEQSIWLMVYLAGAVNKGTLCDPMALGSLVLIALTIGSSNLTESLSAAKYPEYKIYQRTTPMLIPSIRSTDAYTTFLIERSKKRH